MEVKIINENSGNPFRYFDNEQYSPEYPRDYKDSNNVKAVISQLIEKLGLPSGLECLEVGAGHNQNPSLSLSQLGARVITLDADWTHAHTDISYERLQDLKKKLGKDWVIPRTGGRKGDVTSYLGDIAFLRDPKSILKEREFDFIYFWGSINSNGICRSVANSCAAKELGIEIKYADRILKPIPAIRENEIIISVAGYFCGHEAEEAQNIKYNNRRLADLGLYWALADDREAKVLGFFTQSPQSVAERQKLKLGDKTEEILGENPLERIIQTKGYSLFGKEDDYVRLREANEKLGAANRQKFENMGMIDAVFVGF